MARFLARLIAANDRWATPFGDFNHRWLSALFGRLRPITDLLNGRWLGHPVHPAITDVPIGAFLVAFVLDLVGEPTGAFWALADRGARLPGRRWSPASPTTPTPTARPGRGPPSTAR